MELGRAIACAPHDEGQPPFVPAHAAKDAIMTTLARSSPISIVQLLLQGLVALIFLGAGLLNLTGAMIEEMMRLGYPGYFMTLIGVAYLIGILCLYQPRLAFLQEWAFGAMAATLVGAAGSHLAIGDSVARAAPAIVTLILLLAAYALRHRLRR